MRSKAHVGTKKTHSGMKKRVKVTSTGKLLAQKASKRHLLVNKSKKQKKANSGGMPLSPGDAKNVRNMLSI
jgi:large subunit ribosomal protein L35